MDHATICQVKEGVNQQSVQIIELVWTRYDVKGNLPIEAGRVQQLRGLEVETTTNCWVVEPAGIIGLLLGTLQVFMDRDLCLGLTIST